MSTQAIQGRSAASIPVPPTVAEAIQLANLFAQSGYFNDAKTAAQCIVKIEYGRELGIGPAAAMMGVHIIEGKPAPSANLMATLIKRSRRYNFRVRVWTPTACEIDFYERGDFVGTGSFTLEEARQTRDRNGKPLTDKTNWQNYPKAMLWARAMSQGARAYCADVFGGAPVYTPEELDADDSITVTPQTVNAGSGEITTVEGTSREVVIPGDGAPARNGAQARSEAPTGDLEAAWKDYRYIAPQCGYTTEESQKAHIQATYPGRKPKDLTAAEVAALTQALRRDVLDLPAHDGSEVGA